MLNLPDPLSPCSPPEINADASETKKVPETELRESRKRLQLAIAAARLGVWEWNLQDNAVYWSPECLELAGVSDFGGQIQDFENLVHPDDLPLVMAAARKAIRNHENFEVDFRIVDSQGKFRWLSDNGIVEYDADGEPLRLIGTVQDITERKANETLVRESEENFRALVRASTQFTWTAQKDGSSEELFSWLSTLSGERISDIEGIANIVHPDDLENVIRDWKNALETKTLFSNVSRIRTNTGDYRYIASRAVQVFNDDGSFRQWIGTFNDITTRMLAEKGIRESEALNRAVLDSMLSNIAVLNSTGQIRAVNRAWADFAIDNMGPNGNISTADVGANYLDVCDKSEGSGKEEAVAVAAAIRDVLSGRRASFSLKYPCNSSDRQRWFNVNISRLQTAEGGVVVSHSDISDRKLAEDALRKNEAQLQLVANTVPTLIAHLDSAQRCVFANDAFVKWLGRTADNTIGRHVSEFFDSEVYARLLPEFELALSGKAFSIERISFADDSRFLRFSYVPDFGADGEVQGFFAFTVDLTDNKQAEERLRRSEEQLRQSQKLESIGRLAGGIAHDFNNMLTAINGYSDLALMRLEADDPIRHNIEEIRKAGERSAALTHQLLAFSRRQLIELRILNVNQIISDSLVMLQRVIGEDIVIDTVLPDGLWSVSADAGQLTQILLNLVVNSRDAMPHGGRITLETSNVICNSDFVSRHPGSKRGEYARISVSDTGTGIDEETKKHIFEPFFTTKPTGKGTGLGLSMVYGSVKQLHGYVWVIDNEEGGTTFDVYLPRAADEPVGQESIFKGEGIDVTETVLLVEDEPIVRDLTKQLLESFGYHVIEASDGREAIKLHSTYDGRIDLLLTDVVMPEMSGRELSVQLLSIQPDLKILFASGYIEDTSWRHGPTQRVVNFIQKPFTHNNLSRKIREVLDSD